MGRGVLLAVRSTSSCRARVQIAIFDPAGKWLRAILIPSANIGFRVMNNGNIPLQNIPLNH